MLSVVKFEPSDEYETVEVEGLITNLNLNTLTFNLGGSLNVEYTIDSIDNDSNESELADGLWVEVTGKMLNSTLIANKVEVEDFDELESDTEIEGIITSVANDKSSFNLNYKGRFVVNDSTRYEDGNKSNLRVGAEIEVTTKQANGENVATEVEFEHDDNSQEWDDNDIDFEGRVHSVKGQSSFEIQTKSGNQTIHVNQNTRYENEWGMIVDLDLDELSGKLVEVEADKLDNLYIASEIEADDND